METESSDRSNHRRGSSLRHLIVTLRLLFVASAVVVLFGGLTACRFAGETPTAAPVNTTPQPTLNASPTRQTVKRKSAMPLPRLAAALKKNIAARIKTWQASIEARDLEKHLQHYADQIDGYYLASNVNRDVVRADRERAFDQFDTLNVEIINVEIILESSDAATVTFDKSWDFTKDAHFSKGLVQQEIQMRKIEKQWLIVSEKDLQVYRSQTQ